jgi:hypothetical protein
MQSPTYWRNAHHSEPTICPNEPSYRSMQMPCAVRTGGRVLAWAALAVAQSGCALWLDWDDVEGKREVEENVRGADSERDAAQLDAYDAGVDAEATCTQYLDLDGDGYGDPARTLASCDVHIDYVFDAEDCSDDDAAVNPEADESCDGVDEDCDGEIDEAACPPGCAGARFRERSFLGCGMHLAYAQAAEECGRHGMQLADIYDADENLFLIDFASAQGFTANMTAGVPDPYVWIGGSDLAEEGLWTHADGQFFWRGDALGSAFGHYVNWTGGEPNNNANPGEEDCLAMRDDGAGGGWNDFNCANQAGFLCAAPAR